MNTDDLISDEELLGELCNNAQALSEFYRRHIEGVTRYLARRCRNSDDLADAISETFFVVLRSAHTFDPRRGTPTQWLYGIARNEFAKQGHQRLRSAALHSRVRGRTLLSEDDTNRLDEIIDAEKLVAQLEGALESISEGERDLLISMVENEYSIAQASHGLGISSATGRKRLERLRNRVADHALTSQVTHPTIKQSKEK
jgi:RNA polymerase sigma-70 factor (ECF subfamily)